VSEADKLWESLEVQDGDQVVDAVLVGKLANFTEGGTEISISATDGVDWVTQLGMLRGAVLMVENQLRRDFT
jgi:hypothetical protein